MSIPVPPRTPLSSMPSPLDMKPFQQPTGDPYFSCELGNSCAAASLELLSQLSGSTQTHMDQINSQVSHEDKHEARTETLLRPASAAGDASDAERQLAQERHTLEEKLAQVEKNGLLPPNGRDGFSRSSWKLNHRRRCRRFDKTPTTMSLHPSGV